MLLPSGFLARGTWIVWLVAPEIVMLWPLMLRLASSELPLTDALPPLHRAVASDIRKSALIVFPAAVRLRSATDASDRLAFPCPTVVAWATSAPFSAPALPSEIGWTSRREDSWAPPLEGRGPVSATVIGERGGTVA